MIIQIEKDEDDNLILPLGDELCSRLGWKPGDTVKWINNNDGSWSLKKMEKELVMVECVSTFRMRYVVEVPKGKSEWALDSVTMNEVTEFSQTHIGEQIVSLRVIDEDEFIKMFDKDNSYLSGWDRDKKFDCCVLRLDEEKDIEHSEYWYDTERNK